jgi:DNA polymerase-3 subunit beta
MKSISVNRDAFSRSLRIVSILSKERSSAVKVDINPDSMIISTSNPDLGDANDEIPVKYTGESMTFAFNARYLLDVLSAMESETVILRINEPLSPTILMEEGKDDYKCVVMPMRL